LNPYMGSLKSLRYENQIEPFLKYPLGSMFGKIVTPFRGPKLPQNIGRLTH
jgi:hypothetical protein